MEKKWGMQAYKFTVKPQRKVRKAIIPVAGFGTRVYPATRRMKKEFFFPTFFPYIESVLSVPFHLLPKTVLYHLPANQHLLPHKPIF